MERASVHRKGTSDILENARSWNIPVWSLKKLLSWLKLLKQNTQLKANRENKSAASNNKSSSTAKAQKLKPPYIKSEVFNRYKNSDLFIILASLNLTVYFISICYLIYPASKSLITIRHYSCFADLVSYSSFYIFSNISVSLRNLIIFSISQFFPSK